MFNLKLWNRTVHLTLLFRITGNYILRKIKECVVYVSSKLIGERKTLNYTYVLYIHVLANTVVDINMNTPTKTV